MADGLSANGGARAKGKATRTPRTTKEPNDLPGCRREGDQTFSFRGSSFPVALVSTCGTCGLEHRIHQSPIKSVYPLKNLLIDLSAAKFPHRAKE